MGAFSYSDADNYGNNGGNNYFTLKNDLDTARVRFLYNGIEDIEGFAVHQVEIDGRRRYVNCLRDYNEPIENCPLCAARQKVLAKLFVMLYNIDADQVQVWERGKKFFQKIASLTTRYNPLVGTSFEIERRGKAGDQQTSYEIYPLESDDVTLQDFEEDIPEVLGNLILDKNYEELNYFLDTGYFPEEENNSSNVPSRQVPRGTSGTNRGATPNRNRGNVGNNPNSPMNRPTSPEPARPTGRRVMGNNSSNVPSRQVPRGTSGTNRGGNRF